MASHSRSSAPRWRYTLLAILLAGMGAWARWKGWLPEESAGVRDGASRPSAPGRPQAPVRSGKWEEWQGCTLVEDRGNDGDSFLVRHEGADYTLRLYFADCPEKHRHQYNGDRLAEQGRYFGGLTEGETVAMGEAAREFTLTRLRAAPFRVQTRGETVFESERLYAFVTTEEGDLAGLLIRHGLARIFTKGESRPGGASASAEKQRLQGFERQARATKQGAWRLRR